MDRQGGPAGHAPTNTGSGRAKPNNYSAIALTLIAPFWAVGAFILAVGFLAVPKVLLDGKSLAALSAQVTSKGRALGPMLGQTGPLIAVGWSELLAATSRLVPAASIRSLADTQPDTSPETSEETSA